MDGRVRLREQHLPLRRDYDSKERNEPTNQRPVHCSNNTQGTDHGGGTCSSSRNETEKENSDPHDNADDLHRVSNLNQQSCNAVEVAIAVEYGASP